MTENATPFKIERKPVVRMNSYHRGDFKEFVRTLQKLKVGESFTLTPPKSESNYRMAISICQILLGVRFNTAREGKDLRIGRVL